MRSVRGGSPLPEYWAEQNLVYPPHLQRRDRFNHQGAAKHAGVSQAAPRNHKAGNKQVAVLEKAALTGSFPV